MGDLTTLHAQAKRLTLALREGLERLEAAENGQRPGDVSGLAGDLKQKLAMLQKISSEMDGIWRMQIIRENSSKRDVWKRKVEQIAEEADSLKLSLDRFRHRDMKRRMEKQDREELFARAEAGRQAKKDMDDEEAARGAVQRSKAVLNEIFDTGTNILNNMQGTRERLKAAQRKVLDVLNTVGMGESILKLIEKRQRMDILMTYGGMVVLLLIVGLVIWIAWF